MQDQTEILLITGPAGVGKSTLCWEMAAVLAEAKTRHALVETDELDRIFPRPTARELDRIRPGMVDVSGINLAAIWSTYRALGHSRLIMSGVMLHPEFDRRWIDAAVPGAHMTVVRLLADDATLLARLAQREVGAGANAQANRTLKQASRMRAEPDAGYIVVVTDGRTPRDLARDLLRRTGWLSE